MNNQQRGQTHTMPSVIMISSTPIPETAERIRVQTVADILRALADPDIAAVIRQHILTQELLNLPAAFARVQDDVVDIKALLAQVVERQDRADADIVDFKAGQERLETGQARLESDVSELKAGQVRLESGQAQLESDVSELKAGQVRLETGQAQLESDVSELKAGQVRLETGQVRLEGDGSEIKAAQTRINNEFDILRSEVNVSKARRMYGRICEVANLRRPRWMEITELSDLFDAADTTDIPGNELISCQEADLVLKAVSKADGSQHYAVVECSATISQNDIRRVKRNAAHYQRITGCVTHAVAIGNAPPESVLAEAAALQVHCLVPSRQLTHPT